MTAHAVAAGLVVTAMFAAVWAGPVASASSSAPRPRASAAASATPVKYYIVPKPRNGSAQSLYEIAAKTLGNGNRYLEIFRLNKGRLQPDGSRLKSPRVIDPGWILQLPAGAAGPGVRFGPLPVLRRPATAPVSHRRPRPTAAAPAGSSLSPAVAVGGALIVVAAAMLAVILGGRARRRARRKGRGMHGKTPRPKISRTGSPLVARFVARSGQPAWQGGRDPGSLTPDHPSWPASDYPATLTPDHPSWPASDYPATLTPDHPSWPGADQLSWPRAIGRSAEPRLGSSRALHRDPHPHPASPPTAVPGSMTGGPDWGTPTRPPAAPPGRTQRLAGAANSAARAPYEGGPAVGQSQPVLTQAPLTGREQATGPGGQLAVDQADQLVDPIRQQVEDLWRADSIRLAEQVIADADDQAAKIVREAEREAAELRASVTKMTTELGRVAAYVIENLTIPAKPAIMPAVQPAAEPAAQPAAERAAQRGAEQTRTATKPASRPQRDATENLTKPAKPATRPKARPGVSPRRTPSARPGAKPQSRQAGVWRKMVASVVVLFLVGVISGAAEIGMRGFSFFVFRNAGAGAGNSHNLDEDQGPGQPDAPGAHHRVHASRPSGKATGKPGGKAGESK